MQHLVQSSVREYYGCSMSYIVAWQSLGDFKNYASRVTRKGQSSLHSRPNAAQSICLPSSCIICNQGQLAEEFNLCHLATVLKQGTWLHEPRHTGVDTYTRGCLGCVTLGVNGTKVANLEPRLWTCNHTRKWGGGRLGDMRIYKMCPNWMRS